MLADGQSYMAAARATGLTNGQIAGVAHRRGFPSRPNPIGRALTPAQQQRAADAARAAHPRGGAAALADAQRRAAALPASHRQTVAEPDGSACAPPGSEEHTRRVLLGKARRFAAPAALAHGSAPSSGVAHRLCQWPIGEPGTRAFRFCHSAEVVPGRPYCGAHCALAYATRGDAA